MFLLFEKQYDEDFFELSPIVVSKDALKIENYLNNLLKDSIEYDNSFKKHIGKCKNIIKSYLLDNYGAITGWLDVRTQVKTSQPITNKEKNEIMYFLCDNYAYFYGKNVVECFSGFITKYCDIKSLKTPYAKLPEPPKRPNPYHKKEGFLIKDIKCLDK